MITTYEIHLVRAIVGRSGRQITSVHKPYIDIDLDDDERQDPWPHLVNVVDCWYPGWALCRHYYVGEWQA
jgi:hypothetical protein